MPSVAVPPVRSRRDDAGSEEALEAGLESVAAYQVVEKPVAGVAEDDIGMFESFVGRYGAWRG